jgi:undecaprenyl-diphosphatase
MTVFQSIVLGLVQGLTEFLPISSSAHLVLFPWLFGWPDPGLAFDVFLHAGTLAALLAYFFADWTRLLQAGIAVILERRIGFDRDRQLAVALVLASIPGAALGLLVHDYAETAFRAPLLIAVALAILGFLLYWVDGRAGSLKTLDELSTKDALVIGAAQAAALFPGVSRSGATITMGRYLGFSREAAARFSFLLAIPITFGALIFKVDDVVQMTRTADLSWSYLIAGFLASLLSGLAAIHFLLGYVRNADFRGFAWYRLALAAFIIAFSVFSGR